MINTTISTFSDALFAKMNFPIAASCGVSLRYASHTSWFGFTQQHPFGSCFYRSQQAAGYVSHRIKIKNSKKTSLITNGITLASAFVVVMANSASAATIFNLDSSIVGGNIGELSTNYGTLSLTQNGSNVDVVISLTQAWKPLSLYLNYDGSETIASSTTVIDSYPSKSIDFGFNSTKVQGSGNYGNFDLEISGNGNLGNFTSVWKTQLTAVSGSLLESNFIQKDSENNLYAALHIGLGDAASGSLGLGVSSLAISSSQLDSSSAVAAPGAGVGASPSQAVPEPLTILGAFTAIAFGVTFKRHSLKASAK